MNRLTKLVLLVGALIVCVLKAHAQPVTTLYSFVRGPINPRAGLTLGPDGNFYGTTAAGGRNLGGTVFRLTTNGMLTTLFSFSSYPSGAGPIADLTLGPDGNFYGTTMAGGTNLSGTNAGGVVFKMTTNGIPTTVVNFIGANGGHPDAAVTLGPDGYYYGTTEFSGSNNVGTVFKVTTNGTLTTLVTFNNTNGANPVSCLTLAPGGIFYGTTKFGGKFGLGTAFKLTTNGDFTMLNSFNQTNGAWPAGRMTLGPDGNLYGTTAFVGTAFQMTTNGEVTTLADFNRLSLLSMSKTNGEFPYSGLTLGPDGNYYGTTSQGGANGTGTIFQVSTNGTLAMLANMPGVQVQYITNSQGVVFYTTNNFATIAPFVNGELTTLYNFSPLINSNNADGADPESDLTLGPDGNLYGTTVGGGTNGAGAVFKISTNGTFTALASFAGDTGYNPHAGVTAGPGGSLYGVVNSGGTTGYGTAYKVSATGQFTLLHNFSYFPDGAYPQATLIQGSDGNFYGTAVGGGTNLLQTGPNSYQAESFGTVFELATNGAFTTLAYFNGTNGANPYGGLAVGPDGNFYGTTAYGGISNNGVVFRLLTNGTLTALTNFIGANGANPYEGLVLGPDNNFYGTTEAGGSDNDGTIFKVTPDGTLTTLVYFNGTNGANPNDGLTVGWDGNLYGTTYTAGGTGNFGTVFKVTTSGTLTTLYSFAQTNFAYPHGRYPVGGLAQGPDGYLYGTTSLGGVNGSSQGTLFKITTNGTLTTLNSFIIPNGGAPFATLTLQTNGHFINFYGTTLGDGGDHPGTVFRVNLTTSYAIAENTTETFSPLTNEMVWATGGVLDLLTAVATNGTAQISGSSIVFTPATNFTGTATINYTVTDNAGGTNASFITILVTNIPPVATPDFYTVAENSSANVLNPLANDQFLTSGGMLSLVEVNATNGTAVTNGANVIFTPTANFIGTATIGYTITDNIGGTNSSFITVTVAAVSSISVAITSPTSGQTVSNAAFTVTGTAILTGNPLATLTNVYVQLNNGGWSGATSANGWTNWTANVILTPGSNTVSAYAVDSEGNVSSTNSVIFDYVIAPVLADLSLSGGDSPEPVSVGSNLVYYLTIGNAGPSTATGVVLSNRIPAGVTFVSATGGATPSSGVLLVNLGSLAVGSNAFFQVSVRPTAAGSFTNNFQVFANESDPVTVNNSAAVISTVTNAPAVADLSLSASGAPEPVIVGSNLVYSISITNLGPATATGIVVSNQIPTNAVFVSATGGATPSGGSLLLNLGALSSNAVVTAQVVIQPLLPGKLTNSFAVFASQTDPVLTNNSVSVVSTVTNAPPVADLSVTASATPEPAIVGSNLVYAISITNAGPDTASGVVISNQIPTGVTFISATGGATPSGGVLLVNLGSLAAGATTSAQVIVQPFVVGKLTNLFQVFANEADPVLTNNSATVVSTITNAPALPVDVALTLMAAPNPVSVGAPLTYSLAVTNISSTTAIGVIVSNTLPPNVSLFSLLPSQGTASNDAGVVTYFVGDLSGGNAATLAIVVLPDAAGLLTNIAVASSTQIDSQPANNRATNVTTAMVQPITNLVLTVLSSSMLDPQTGLFEQRIQVANGGPATPSSVLVTVSGLPANAEVYNATGTTNGLPYVQSSSPLGIGSNVVFLLEYYVPTRVAPTNLTFTVQTGPVVIPPVVNGTILSVSRTLVLANGNVLIEFSAVPGQIYAIQYSRDMTTWLTAMPAITAPANQVQWIDSGPPKTVSNPAQQGERYYRVVMLSAQ